MYTNNNIHFILLIHFIFLFCFFVSFLNSRPESISQLVNKKPLNIELQAGILEQTATALQECVNKILIYELIKIGTPNFGLIFFFFSFCTGCCFVCN
jgi:hypothetical protein